MDILAGFLGEAVNSFPSLGGGNAANTTQTEPSGGKADMEGDVDMKEVSTDSSIYETPVETGSPATATASVTAPMGEENFEEEIRVLPSSSTATATKPAKKGPTTEKGPATKGPASRANRQKALQQPVVEDSAAESTEVEGLADIAAEESDGSSYGREKKVKEKGEPTNHTHLLREDEKPERLLGVMVPGLRQAPSSYLNYKYPLPRVTERELLRNIEKDEPKTSDDEIVVELVDFVFYQTDDKARMDNEFCGLQELCVSRGMNALLLDGIVVTSAGERYYVERVRFGRSSIGGYFDDDIHTIGDRVWIQSDLGRRINCWYKPTRPSPNYLEYWEPFLWLATFGKHFVDFLEHEKKPLLLRDFEINFDEYIQKLHGAAPEFQRWYAEYGRSDFRQVVVAHHDFLWQQTSQMKAKLANTHYAIWKECRLENIPEAPGKMIMKTVTTPLVHQFFEPIFGENLMKVEKKYKGPPVEMEAVVVPKPTRVHRTENGRVKSRPKRGVKVGDVIGISPDTDTKWKKGKSEFWFGYVHEVYTQQARSGTKTKLGVVWLYLPEDTLLRGTNYIYPNELFFSNHCNCNESPLTEEDVDVIFSGAFGCGPGESGKEYFIRQEYDIETGRFLTLDKNKLNGCPCVWGDKLLQDHEIVARDYKVGDSVLIVTGRGNDKILEPAIFEGFVGGEDPRKINLRVLYRKRDDLGHLDASINELVYSEDIVVGDIRDLERKCRVRFFKPDEKIATPYDRQGCGGTFFIRFKIDSHPEAPSSPSVSRNDKRRSLNGKGSEKRLKNLIAYPFEHSVRESYILGEETPKAPLNGMDLFCGGGNFGRGIEEGGAVINRWAVDLFTPALCTYAANNKHDANFYLGSVNNFLKNAIEENFSDLVPPPGQVDFISAGSPCQGFSNANPNKYSEKSNSNASLVASVASFVDHYRPKYALLENVHGMAAMRKLPDGTEYNCFAVFLSCLVAMGYQVQHFTMDSWSHGSSQLRVRLFVSIAAPGERLPPPPPRSHTHAPGQARSRALFEAPNGKKYAARDIENPVIFKYISAKESLKDLPYIGDAHPHICIPYPDHRPSRREGTGTRTLMSEIPVWDTRFVRVDNNIASMRSLKGARSAGYIDKEMEDRVTMKKRRLGSKAWGRIDPILPIRTITTTVTPQCDFTGQWLHYEQHRLLTVQEVRRAQSFPDHEVILGSTPMQFKIVGNSVDRMVSLSLGISIRDAWFGDSLSIRYHEVTVPVGGWRFIKTTTTRALTTSRSNSNKMKALTVSSSSKKTVTVQADAVAKARAAVKAKLDAQAKEKTSVKKSTAQRLDDSDTIVVHSPPSRKLQKAVVLSPARPSATQRRVVVDDEDESDELPSAPAILQQSPTRKRRHSQIVPEPLAEPSEDELNIPSSIRKSASQTQTPVQQKKRRLTITQMTVEQKDSEEPAPPTATVSEDSEEALLFGRFKTPTPPPSEKQSTHVRPQSAGRSAAAPKSDKKAGRASTGGFGLGSLLSRAVAQRENSLASSMEDPIVLD